MLLGGGCAAPTPAAPTGLDVASGADGPAVWPATAADLQEGLLGSREVTAGFVPVTGTADEDGARAVFEGAGCEELARWLNIEKVPGSRMEATVALASGPQGAAAVEQLYAMDSPRAAAQVVDRYRRAAGRCTKITLSVAGAGTSTHPVRPISLVEVGDASFASGASAEAGDSFADQDIIHVVAHRGAVVIATTLMGADPSDAETVTQAAVDKVHHKLAGLDRPAPPQHRVAGECGPLRDHVGPEQHHNSGTALPPCNSRPSLFNSLDRQEGVILSDEYRYRDDQPRVLLWRQDLYRRRGRGNDAGLPDVHLPAHPHR